MSDEQLLAEPPAFASPEAVVRCWCAGMGDIMGCPAIDIERIPSGNAHVFTERVEKKARRLAAAWAIMRRAQQPVGESGGGLTRRNLTVVVAMLVEGKPWHEAAEDAGMEDSQASADAVRMRVMRAYHAGLRCIGRCM